MKRGDSSPKRESRASLKSLGSSATRKPLTSGVKTESPLPLSTPSEQELIRPLPTTPDLLLSTLITQLKIKDEQLARKDEQIRELTRQVGLVVESHNYRPVVRSQPSPTQLAEPDNPEELSEQPVYGAESDKAEVRERDQKAQAVGTEIEEELAKLYQEQNPPPPVAVVTPRESVDDPVSA